MRKFFCILSLMALVLTFSGNVALADNAPKKGKGKLFEKMDTNGDGKISKAEFETFMAAKGKGKGGKAAKHLFAKLDTNKDGYLSKQELAKLGKGKGGQKKAK